MIVNEPRIKSANHTIIANWCNTTATYIKTIDSNHLVTCGIEGLGFNETWGEGSDMISTYNNSVLDYATFAMNTGQWGYMVGYVETSVDNTFMCAADGSNCNIGNANVLNFWSWGHNYTYNSRWYSGVAQWLPQQPRHSYDNWAQQNVEWANSINKPVMLQELVVDQSYSDAIKNQFYQQTINTFYSNGGDGIMLWTMNSNDYYIASNTSGTGLQDDGYGFYFSDDATLKARSASTIAMINYSQHNNTGSTSWVTLLNNKKYNFNINVATPDNVAINNCTLNLNISNATTTHIITQINSTPITQNTDYVFSQQFASSDTNFTWYTQCDASGTIYTSSSTFVSLDVNSVTVALSSPGNNTYKNNNTISFNYIPTSTLDINYCDFYIDGVKNQTSVSVTTGVTNTFTQTFYTTANHTWYIYCQDTNMDAGTSDTWNVQVDVSNPTAILSTPANNSYHNVSQNFSANLTDNLGIQNATISIYDSLGNLVNSTFYTIGGAVQAAIGAVVNLVDGVYTWFVELFDLAGNQYVTLNNTVTIDTVAPNLIITSPINNSNFTTSSLLVNYTVSDATAGLDSCWTSINGGSNVIITCGSNISFTANQGTNTVAVYANDTLNHINSSSVTMFVDSILPVINITYPINGTWYGDNTIGVNYTATDTNLDTCKWTRNGGSTNTTIVCGTNITGQTWLQGINNVTIYANDSLGNDGSSLMTFFISSAPIVNFTSPTALNGTTQTSKNILINVSVTNYTALINITVNLYDSSHTLINSVFNNESNNYNLSFDSLADGVYYYNATATNTFNQSNSTDTRYIWIYTASPPPYGDAPGGSGSGTDYSTGNPIITNASIINQNFTIESGGIINKIEVINQHLYKDKESIFNIRVTDLINQSVDAGNIKITGKISSYPFVYSDINRIGVGIYEVTFKVNEDALINDTLGIVIEASTGSNVITEDVNLNFGSKGTIFTTTNIIIACIIIAVIILIIIIIAMFL